MPIATLTVRTTVSGLVSHTGAETVTGSSAEVANPTVPAAKTGTLTTRTSDSVGTLTMASGSHGITTGQRIDLYWSGGSRYGLLVGTVAGTAVPFTAGAGDNLPADETAVTVGIPVEKPFDVIGSDLVALEAGGQGASRARVVFTDAEASNAATILLDASGPPYTWLGDGTNLLAEITTVSVWISTESTSATTNLAVVGLR